MNTTIILAALAVLGFIMFLLVGILSFLHDIKQILKRGRSEN